MSHNNYRVDQMKCYMLVILNIRTSEIYIINVSRTPHAILKPCWQEPKLKILVSLLRKVFQKMNFKQIWFTICVCHMVNFKLKCLEIQLPKSAKRTIWMTISEDCTTEALSSTHISEKIKFQYTYLNPHFYFFLSKK